MEYFKPMHIKNDNDLQIYENYLKENYSSNNTAESEKLTEYQKPEVIVEQVHVPKTLSSPAFSNGYLRKNQGKLVKVESLIGNMLDTKIGILLDVGADYIAIKLYKSCCSMLIPTGSVKYITIIHDNDIRKTAT